MPTHQDVLAEARTWIGTPYHHQQCVKGHGVDCGQLIVGVGNALGLNPMLSHEQVRYSRSPMPRKMGETIASLFDPITEAEARFGDIFWMATRPGLPQHLGLYSDHCGGGMIHTESFIGFVVETALDEGMRKMIHSWWRYRGIYVGA